MEIDCHRATDGSELFLLRFSYGRGVRPPHVLVLNRAQTEDLIHEVTSAVKSYDDAQKKGGSPTPNGGLIA